MIVCRFRMSHVQCPGMRAVPPAWCSRDGCTRNSHVECGQPLSRPAAFAHSLGRKPVENNGPDKRVAR